MEAQANSLSSRGMKSITVLGARRDHGDRLRYMAGCRCFACRRANSAYEAERKIARASGQSNGIVPAARARAHMKALSAQGVGRRSVGAASDVSDTVLTEIISGRKTNIRAATERAILAVTVDAAGDRALIPAKPTWKLLNELIKDGYKKGELAMRLGNKQPSLQLDKQTVTVRSAYLVERLYQELRCVGCKETIKLLAALRDEGYTQVQIDRRLAAFAESLGEQVPVLKPNKHGRISAKAADLVYRLHQQLTA